jgi:hypothetical protein
MRDRRDDLDRVAGLALTKRQSIGPFGLIGAIQKKGRDGMMSDVEPFVDGFRTADETCHVSSPSMRRAERGRAMAPC